ncbi:MAG: hypothetical protein H8E35_07580 [Ardenticatenia bacterium]|nr:hypothetical protein [Ardenticatenia bacterium]
MAKHSPASPPPLLPFEPDYSRLPPLQPVEAGSLPSLAPLVVIGVGPVGQAVLEMLAPWLPVHSANASHAIRMLAVRLDGEPKPDFALPQVGMTSLMPEERLELGYKRGEGSYAWYPSSVGYDWIRPDGRLGLFQDLGYERSALWDTLQGCMADGSKPDVWMVSSAFDAVGSGVIFDLAHLARLVGRAQRYEPFIGWMLALPSVEWGEEHQPEATATLRELTRLLRHDVPRIYKYNPDSDNRSLHLHQARGSEDANLVLLCEPPAEVYGRQAAEFAVSRMAQALLTLAQPAVWQAFRDDVRTLGPLRHHEEEALVSAFGVCAHYVPLPELQGLVRAWLTRDVLFGQEWGAAQAWRRAQVEPDENTAMLLLRQAGHSFLDTLAQASSSLTPIRRWPRADGADKILALALRQHLQEIANRPPPGNNLLACDELLAGMEEVFLRARAPSDMMVPLEETVAQAQQELRNWLHWLRKANQMTETVIANAQKQWEQSTSRTGWRSVVDKGTARSTYESLISGTPDIRQSIRRYVRWAWVVKGKRLHLRLDTLYPSWMPDASGGHHDPDAEAWSQLWRGTQRVVTALTRESSYWPSSLTGPDCALPSTEEAQEAAALALGYDIGIAQAVRTTRKVAYQTSGDTNWLERSWLPAGVTLAKAVSSSRTLGLLLQVHHLISISAVQSLADLRRRYGNRHRMAHTLHVFEPEQLAAQIEERALATLPRRRRSILASTWLSSRTVAALQWPDSVNLFVNAWLANLVEPTFGHGPYRLLRPDLGDGVLQEICVLAADHPLEALHAFVLEEEHLAEQEELARFIQKVLANQGKDLPTRLEEIAGWWESPDPRNVEWYMLVHGLRRRRRS